MKITCNILSNLRRHWIFLLVVLGTVILRLPREMKACCLPCDICFTPTVTPPAGISPTGISPTGISPTGISPTGIPTWTCAPTNYPVGPCSNCVNGVLVAAPCNPGCDTTPPTITCPPPVNTNTTPGVCYATGVILGTPATSDNCGVASVINDAPAQFSKGVTTVTWTVTDTSGITNSCTQTVTVEDQEPPTIVCTNLVFATDATNCAAWVTSYSNITATDNCGSVTISNVPALPYSFPVGTNLVTTFAIDTDGNTNTYSHFARFTRDGRRYELQYCWW